ncbi:hypothetical protein, partial [Acidisoma cellulosilyticum]|uniref:hypothetical protein n=1 Tax=Acidisoma cellulosilyticum TaxID=2802395 RepID=UPI001D0A679A
RQCSLDMSFETIAPGRRGFDHRNAILQNKVMRRLSSLGSPAIPLIGSTNFSRGTGSLDQRQSPRQQPNSSAVLSR